MVNVRRKRTTSSAPAKRYKSSPKTKLTVRAPVAKIWKPVSSRAGQGNNIRCTFLYSTKFSLNGGTLGASNQYQFSLSSLFDPDFTGVGTQPIPLDQYAALYERYRVYEVSFKVVFFSGDASFPQIAGYNVCDVNTTSTDLERLVQNGQCEWAPLGPKGSSSDTVTLFGTVDIAKAHGISRQRLMSDDLYASVFTSSPSEQLLLNLFTASAGTNDPGAGECYIELRYKAMLEGNTLTITS